MSPEERQELEAELRNLFDAERYEKVATKVFETYGPEIYRYVISVLEDEILADESFSLFSENVWKGLEGFKWQSSMRTWLYVIARNSINRVTTDPFDKRGQRLSTTQGKKLAARARTATQPYRRTEVKDRFSALREQLEDEEREILALRVDQEMEWQEVAAVMLGDDTDSDAIKRKSAALRKRFERIKFKLKGLAQEAGLLDG